MKISGKVDFNKLLKKLNRSSSKLNDLYYAFCYKFFIKRNTIKITTLKDTGYIDPDEILLHVNFQVLVDYVKECSYHNYTPEISKSLLVRIREMLPFPFYHLLESKKEQLKGGIEYLNWAINLNDENVPEFSTKAKEVLDLYIWWTETRPNRPDPMDASGWSDQIDFETKKYGSWFSLRKKDENGDFYSLPNHEDYMEPEDYKNHRKTFEDLINLDKKYDQEDEDMLIKLIKIRKTLWL